MPNEAIIHEVYIPLTPLVQKQLLGQLQSLISESNQSQKLATAQILISHVPTPNKLINVTFINQFDDKLHAIFALASFLPAETLKEIAIQILEEPIDQNE
jgi:hypothetical protein